MIVGCRLVCNIAHEVVEDEERTLWKGAPPLRRDTVELELSAKVESKAHSTK